jgi:hypothetical protein
MPHLKMYQPNLKAKLEVCPNLLLENFLATKAPFLLNPNRKDMVRAFNNLMMDLFWTATGETINLLRENLSNSSKLLEVRT